MWRSFCSHSFNVSDPVEISSVLQDYDKRIWFVASLKDIYFVGCHAVISYFIAPLWHAGGLSIARKRGTHHWITFCRMLFIRYCLIMKHFWDFDRRLLERHNLRLHCAVVYDLSSFVFHRLRKKSVHTRVFESPPCRNCT